jgi:DegV family protein with EDD domain
MAKVALVSDSTAYLPADLVKRYSITVTPQSLIWGEEHFQDGIDILPDEFYRRLAAAKEMPTTAQVSVVTMKDTFNSLLEQGFDVLGMFISSKLSGTVQSALQGREMIPKARDRIVIVDTLSTSMAMGFQLMAVARAIESGADLADCQRLALETQEHTGVFFVVETLEFLRRGGRIGGASALLGTTLNIKPILQLREGRIEAVEKVRTKRKAYQRMIALIEQEVASRTPVRLAVLHANADADAREVLDTGAKVVHPVETVFTSVSPVVGTHAGPGTVGLAYMAGM